MQVRRFIVAQIPAAGEELTLPPGEALHAGRVLRLRLGDPLDLLDGAGTRAEAVLSCPGSGRRFDGMACRVLRCARVPETSLHLRLYIAPPRSRSMGDVVRCATELGVRRITPLRCRFGVSRPDPGARDGWFQDAQAAMKQSGNPFLPGIDLPEDFAGALQAATEPGVFGAVPRAEAVASMARSAAHGPHIGLWIGPEGGFAPEEEQALYERGFVPLTVGPWILRVETAVPALLGRLWGEHAHA